MSMASLGSHKYRKTMTLLWYSERSECGIDREGMNTRLSTIWKRYRPQCRRGSCFSFGETGGCMEYVPIECGLETMTVIREFYGKALVAR